MPIFCRRTAAADRIEPVADQAPHHFGVDRNFPPDGGPELRIEDARRPGECVAREQLPPGHADAGREVVGLSSMARAARRLASSVSCRFSGLELLGRHVGRGRGSPALGVSSARRLRRREPRREIRDRALKGEAERIVLGLQVLEIAVGEFLSLSADSVARAPRASGRDRADGVLRPSCPRPIRTKARTAQCNRRNADAGFIGGHPTMAGPRRQLAPLHHAPSPGRFWYRPAPSGMPARASGLRHLPAAGRVASRPAGPPVSLGRPPSCANSAFTLPGEKGCALDPALLKGALTTMRASGDPDR